MRGVGTLVTSHDRISWRPFTTLVSARPRAKRGKTAALFSATKQTASTSTHEHVTSPIQGQYTAVKQQMHRKLVAVIMQVSTFDMDMPGNFKFSRWQTSECDVTTHKHTGGDKSQQSQDIAGNQFCSNHSNHKMAGNQYCSYHSNHKMAGTQYYSNHRCHKIAGNHDSSESREDSTHMYDIRFIQAVYDNYYFIDRWRFVAAGSVSTNENTALQGASKFARSDVQKNDSQSQTVQHVITSSPARRSDGLCIRTAKCTCSGRRLQRFSTTWRRLFTPS